MRTLTWGYLHCGLLIELQSVILLAVGQLQYLFRCSVGAVVGEPVTPGSSVGAAVVGAKHAPPTAHFPPSQTHLF